MIQVLGSGETNSSYQVLKRSTTRMWVRHVPYIATVFADVSMPVSHILSNEGHFLGGGEFVCGRKMYTRSPIQLISVQQ